MKNYSDTYNTYYRNNAAAIFCYKSSRKNSKCELFTFNHLINHKSDRKVKNESIINQMLGTIEQVLCYSKKYKHIEISATGSFFKQVEYINANNETYHDIEDIPFYFERCEYYSCESVINQIYNIYCFVYPYNTISREELYKNPSIKYIINKFYH